MDLILLHAPSVFDFRKESIYYGPISDVVPSTPVFEMYPVGMASISAYLERHGLRVRIVNLAYRMLESDRFDPAAMIRRLSAPLFGIDLHWLPHAHGSLATAALVKDIHPASKTVIGGLSATYYHRELMAYPQVDFVLRGDSTEEPLRLLIAAVKAGGGYETVPNLTWRDATGTVRENPLSNVPASLDYADFSYRVVLNQVFRHADLKSVVPFQGWIGNPITMTLLCRGCVENCVICGGSDYAFRNFYGREKIGVRSPARYVEDIVKVGRMTRAPVFLVGDMRQMGQAYADEVLDRLAASGIENDIVFEFFRAVDEPYMQKIARSVPGFSMEMSPETHDETIRMAAGKKYTTREFEETVALAVKHGAKKVDIYYMTGIPRQTYASVMETVDYSRRLMREFGRAGNVFPFISPLAPFLDPGSIAFEEPDKVGYTIRFRTLEEHRRALVAPSWKYTMNYETRWMNRDEIVDATYEAALRLTALRAETGALDKEAAAEQGAKIAHSRQVMGDIDAVVAAGDLPPAAGPYRELLHKGRGSTMIDSRELMFLFSGRGIRLRRLMADRIKWLLGR